MDEVSNQDAVLDQNLAQSESVVPQTEPNQEAVSENSQSQNKAQSDQQDKSWIRKVRRDRDDAIRQKEEAERKAKMQEELIKQLMLSQGSKNPVEEEDILQQIQKEEYVPGDKVAKALKKQQDDFNRQLAELKKVQDQQFYARQEENIKATYKDYDDVVNPDTLEILKETNPRLFNRVANLLKADPMDGAVFAYETISAAGITDKVPDLRREKEVEKKLEQNKKTIQSPASFEKRPIAQAMSYPESKKARDALWQETLRYANQAGGGY